MKKLIWLAILLPLFAFAETNVDDRLDTVEAAQVVQDQRLDVLEAAAPVVSDSEQFVHSEKHHRNLLVLILLILIF